MSHSSTGRPVRTRSSYFQVHATSPVLRSRLVTTLSCRHLAFTLPCSYPCYHMCVCRWQVLTAHGNKRERRRRRHHAHILEEPDTRAIHFSTFLFPGESSKFLLQIPEIYSCPKRCAVPSGTMRYVMRCRAVQYGTVHGGCWEGWVGTMG